MVYKDPQPWAHQRQAVELAEPLNHFAFLMEQGTGKTRAMIDTLSLKYIKHRRILRTLIVGPGIVVNNWINEFKLYSDVPHDRLIPVVGTQVQRLQALNHPARDAVYITSYTSLLMTSLLTRFCEMGFQIVVLDESQKIKTHNAKTTKAALKVRFGARYRYILTGTPILNTIMDLYSQFLFLDDGKALGDKFTQFREEYFQDFNENMPGHCYFPNWVMKPGSQDRVQKKIKPISLRVLKSECLDLPPLVKQTIEVPMTTPQKRIYREMEKDMVARLADDTEATADLAITQILRLQQVVSGYITNEWGNDVEVSNERIKVLGDVLETIGHQHKVIVWAVFRSNYKAIRALFESQKTKYVEVTGDMSQAAKDKAIHDFTNDPKVTRFLGHPQSAGIGVNLTVASYCCFFSRGYSLENDLQAEARNYRGGSEQHEKVTRIDLVTPGTIDEVILSALAKKQSLSEAVLSYYYKR
jgi:SNF2 family DNA or RNA helicase